MPGPYSAANPPPWATPSADSARWGGPLAAEYMREANRISGLEEGDRSAANNFVRAEFERGYGGPGITDRDVNRMFAGSAATAGRQSLMAQREARQAFGDQGITGGGVQQQAGTDIALRRYGQLTDSKAGWKQFQMQENAAQKYRRQQASLGIGQAMMAPHAAAGLDAIGDLLGVSVEMGGVRAAREQAAQTSRDTRFGAMLGLGGQVAGGLLGLV